MKIIQKAEQKTVYYLSVESHYVEVKEAKGKDDAVLFEMGQFNKKQEIAAGLTVNVEKARAFAEAILEQCNEIEGREHIEANN